MVIFYFAIATKGVKGLRCVSKLLYQFNQLLQKSRDLQSSIFQSKT